MKKVISLLITLCLLCTCCMAEETPAAAADSPVPPSMWKEGDAHRIEQKNLPLHVGAVENLWPEDFPVYLIDGAEDLPWLDVRSFADVLGALLSAKDGGDGESDIAVTADEAKKTVTWTRREKDLVLFDFAQQKIMWSDYEGFSRREGRPYIDLMQGFPTDVGNGQTGVIKAGDIRERMGKPVILDLKKYGVPMVAQDGLYLVPMQTLAAFFLSRESLSLYYNQQCLILTTPSEFDQVKVVMASMLTVISTGGTADLENLSPEEAQEKMLELIRQSMAEQEQPSLYNTYLAGPKGGRSLAMTDYGLNELCMELDCLYGLKDAHDIDSFMSYFTETGLLPELISTDPETADEAIRELANVWLDDGHSGFYNNSYLTETKPLMSAESAAENGFSKSGRRALQNSLTAVRRNAMGGAVPEYTEIGDTAFVTLDGFTNMNRDYYADPAQLQKDTFTIIIQAHRQITRENSPIKNVVLDLSINTGGATPAATYLLSWMLGDARLSVKDMFSGAESTVEYRADVNLDHVFDEQDTLAGRGLRLFCLTSPVSFSCANLVPWAFKEDGTVKLLGSVTGGGSCGMLPMTTAWGTSYVISGPDRISFLKNGAYYDVDRGAEPDYVISSYDRYYDREALAEFIRNLY